jgi:sulfonate transport system permease protein
MTSVTDPTLLALAVPKRRVALPNLRGLGQGLIPWLLPALIVLAWEISSRLGGLSATLLPAPSDVIAAGVRLTKTGELQNHLLVSFGRAISGLALGGSLAFLFGLANGLSRLG